MDLFNYMKKPLEDAFLDLTGKVIRAEEANSVDALRQMGQIWSGKRR